MGIEDYMNRLKKYISSEICIIRELKNTKNFTPGQVKMKEGEEILKKIKSNDRLILLDERGKKYSSTEFASFLSHQLMLPAQRLVFIIGGAFGVSEEVYKRKDEWLSLSKLTFSHQLTRVILLEQLYRAFTILKGEPYHHS